MVVELAAEVVELVALCSLDEGIAMGNEDDS